jgi:hypothetical protein
MPDMRVSDAGTTDTGPIATAGALTPELTCP